MSQKYISATELDIILVHLILYIDPAILAHLNHTEECFI